MFNTGLESEFTEVARWVENPKFLPDDVDAESKDDSMEGKGSRSLSRLREVS